MASCSEQRASRVTRSVLITDGEQRSALACVRSLGRCGLRPFVVSAHPRPLAGASRFAVEVGRAADPLLEPDTFVDDLRRYIEEWDIEALLPMTDASCLAVLRNRDALGPVCLPLPSEESFRAISDKGKLLEVARALGIRVPKQIVVDSAGDVDLSAMGTLKFPLVLKPARSVVESSGKIERFGVAYAEDGEDLLRKLAALPPPAFPVLLQERVSGPGVGVFLLLWDGAPLATFAHRRIREKPPSGGVSVYRESTRVDPSLVDRSADLLREYDWRGVAMIEYKIDDQTGEAVLMEVNGRFWGSLQLAIDAGVDFPRLLLMADETAQPQPISGYQVPVRSRWLWGDADQLLARLRRSRASLSLPPDSPGRISALLEFLRWRRGDRTEVLRLSDPRPFLRETLQRLKPT